MGKHSLPTTSRGRLISHRFHISHLKYHLFLLKKGEQSCFRPWHGPARLAKQVCGM